MGNKQKATNNEQNLKSNNQRAKSFNLAVYIQRLPPHQTKIS